MLRSDTGPEKTSEKPDPLEDLSYKRGYINASTAILSDLLLTTIPAFDLYSLAGICTQFKLLRNKKVRIPWEIKQTPQKYTLLNVCTAHYHLL